MEKDVKIGKYVLENLTTGMYEDSKIVYREYIQNSADQIDKAIDFNLFPDESLFIDITIDKAKRTIIIKDNATGIEKREVHSKLANVADSTKERGVDKGFRGIGRLGGLAYCETLRFITSFKGENEKTIMTWDAGKVRKLINDKNNTMNVQEIIQQVIAYNYENEDVNEHYFTVEMINVKTENTSLLELEEVKEYIQWNCPVPIANQFLFTNKIKNKSNELNLPIDEYVIYLNNDDLHKAYTDRLIDTNGKSYDEIRDIEFNVFKDNDDKTIAWSWIGISGFDKAIPPKNNKSKGIRLRKENIQIGNDDTLRKFFTSDPRGNGYFVGEIHIVHDDLIPNARRDYFNETSTLVIFEKQLEDYLNKIWKYCRDASQYKNAVKAIKNYEEVKNEMPQLAIDSSDIEEHENKTKELKMKAVEAKKMIDRLEVKLQSNEKVLTAMKSIYTIDTKDDYTQNTLTSKSSDNSKKKKKQQFLTSELSSLNKGERKVVEKIYKILKDNLPQELSKELIEKIQGELK